MLGAAGPGLLFAVIGALGLLRPLVQFRPNRIVSGEGVSLDATQATMAAAVAMAGMPPLSGFVGKLLVLQATGASSIWGVIWATVLITSLIAIAGMMRAGSLVFWKATETQAALAATAAQSPGTGRMKVEPDEQVQDAGDAPSNALAFTAVGALLAGMALLTIFAGPVSDYAQATADQLLHPAAYIDAVLNQQEGTR